MQHYKLSYSLGLSLLCTGSVLAYRGDGPVARVEAGNHVNTYTAITARHAVTIRQRLYDTGCLQQEPDAWQWQSSTTRQGPRVYRGSQCLRQGGPGIAGDVYRL